MNKWDISLLSGEILKYTLDLVGDNNAPYDLTGHSFDVEPPEAPITISISDPAQGKVVLQISSLGKSVGAYPYEVYMNLPNGERWYMFGGHILIESGPVP